MWDEQKVRFPRFCVFNYLNTFREGIAEHQSLSHMANRGQNRSGSTRGKSSRGRHKGDGKTSPFIFIGITVIIVGGIIAWLLWPTSKDKVDLSKMEDFVAETQIELKQVMPDETEVYIDFSDGMQWAYKDQSIKDNLTGIVNKLTKTSEFYSLANEKITPMGRQDSKAIYNQIVSDNSYKNTSAPLEQTLARIVEEGHPAFLMTDFEEYSNKQIQQENWAKDYFIKWLKMGNDITFYVMDYTENGKPKHLYFTVFDGKQHSLLKDIDDALVGKVQNYTRFTLSNDNFPMARNYHKDIVGGNYHEIKADGTPGNDNVTMVDERGTKDSYRVIDGYYAEVYPMEAGTWSNVIANAKALSQQGTPENLEFKHLISQRYVDLTQNSGYDVEALGLIVTDVTGQFVAWQDSTTAQPKVVRDMFQLSMPEDIIPEAYELIIDLDPKFDGTFPNQEESEKALYRLDVVVAKATPKYALVEQLFSWPGNNSLAESVRNALQTCNPDDNLSHMPQGERLFTFYLKMK